MLASTVYAGGSGGDAYIVPGLYHHGGGGGSAGNLDGPGLNGASGTDPLGAAARSGVLSLGSGGTGYTLTVQPVNGGIGAGGGGGHDLDTASGGSGIVSITLLTQVRSCPSHVCSLLHMMPKV